MTANLSALILSDNFPEQPVRALQASFKVGYVAIISAKARIERYTSLKAKA